MGASHNIIRVLSKLGVCSRKQAVEYVQAGRVSVNGKTVLNPGMPASVNDRILVDGKAPAKNEKICVLFNKPPDCVTTRSDELGRKTVYDYLGDMGQWLFPVGRLDLESEGLLLFTNDTAFGNRLTDPRFSIPRTYLVTLDGPLSPAELERIGRGGVDIGRGECSGPASLSAVPEASGGFTVRITLTEGKNRELRRLFEVFGRKVLRLLRTDFGGFSLGDIAPGQWRKCPVPPAPSAPNHKARNNASPRHYQGRKRGPR
ncbi:MAG: rRNA pseudouridine synthase [Elusimicrobia bacterium]|nr:rRNA pseudouridine synthase [Elusimicrobiota bacterium]